MKSSERSFYRNSTLAVLTLLVLGGCSCSLKPGSQNSNQNQTGPVASTNDAMPKPGLLGMLMGKDGVKCQVENNGQTYQIVSKNSKVKIEGISIPSPASNNNQAQNMTGTTISDGKTLYIWNGKMGYRMNIEDAQKNATQSGQPSAPVQNWTDWAKQMDSSGAKYQCDNANISDSEFTPPSDVTFRDFSQMMQNLPKAVTPENLPSKPPTDLPFNAKPQ